MIARLFKNPIAAKRYARLKEMKRAYLSLWLLMILYAVSFCSELICNDIPLYVNYQGKSYFPIFSFYPEDTFTGNGKQTRPDYHKVNRGTAFREGSENYMIFPPIPFGPYSSVNPDSIKVSDHVILDFKPLPMIGTVNVSPDYTIRKSASFDAFVGLQDHELRGKRLSDYVGIPAEIQQAVAARFQNKNATAISAITSGPNGNRFIIALSNFSPRAKAPGTVRLTFREPSEIIGAVGKGIVEFTRQLDIIPQEPAQATGPWNRLSPTDRKRLLDLVQSRFLGPVESQRLKIDGRNYTLTLNKEDISFPYQPTKRHFMGIDGAGRDVFARILYGLRISMSFGLLLVGFSMVLGIIAGALQGYYGGIADITAQRGIEIWSALPFLYIMILMGSTYGRSFPLLLFCYGIFNWIGISYYIRAEFLRLRRQPFVEAGKCMGISTSKIIFRHILPNALVPVITFFPFSLVGAIGSLAALDYLGFGLPPPTPSWGELLFQAQQYRWAWWLILYPSLALFFVMLLGVFIGEGIRNAYDPKRYTRLE